MKILELQQQRIAFRENYTMSNLYLNEGRFCNIIEDKVRILGPNGEGKVWGKTAIPANRYKITIEPTTIKLWDEYVKEFGHNLPLLHDVPFFDRIRIHHGTDETNTEGCLIVGKNTQIGKVLESRITLIALMRELIKYQEMWINITEKR